MAVLAVVLVACGPPPIEQYFDSVERITREMRRDSIVALPDPDLVTRDAVAEINTIRLKALDELNALVQPLEVDAEHLALVTALSDLTSATGSFLTDTDGFDTSAFRDAALGASDLQQAAAAFDRACGALEARGPEFELTNDLGC